MIIIPPTDSWGKVPEMNDYTLPADLKGVRDRYAAQGFDSDTVALFQKMIYRHYQNHGRDLPWRNTGNPYHVLVSEIMLQHTQVKRVITKFGEFIGTFPDFSSLSRSSLEQVLAVWQGLGYNRQIRGMILKTLLTHPGLTERKLVSHLEKDRDVVRGNLEALRNEGLITKRSTRYAIS